jgi:6-phosphogluconolactonase
MKTWVRAVQVLLAATAAMGLTNCGKYNCNSDDGFSFSGSTCSSGSPSSISSSGSGSSGSGGSVSAAFAFAVDEGGTIDGYTLNTSAGTFAATTGYTAPVIPTSGGGYGLVVAQEQYLYAAIAETGQIFGWSIGSDGTLTTIGGSPVSASYLIGNGSANTQGVIVNPAGTLLFVENINSQGIYVYSIGSGGALTLVSGSPFAVPFFPGNLATDGQGKYLYAATNTNGTEIAAYSIGSTGALTAVAGSPFAYPMLQIRGEPTGNYMIGAKGGFTGDTHLYVFSIAQSGSNAGAITQLQSITTTYAPIGIAVQSNSGGNLVYSFSENSTQTGYNPIEGYELSNGALTAVTGSPFSNVSDGFWGQFDQSGTFLFPYSTVANSGTGVITTQLGVVDVASGGALTQPISAATFATEGFWTVTDPK